MAAVIVKMILNMLVSNQTVRNISCDSRHKLFSVYHPAHGKFNVTTQQVNSASVSNTDQH